MSDRSSLIAASASRLQPGPAGRKPRRMLSPRNIMLYGTLLVAAIYYLIPLYVMVVTSLKGMPEVRLGNIFSPPLEITFEPWVKAWSQACTGLNCDGLSRGFWNSVLITIPSTLISIAVASVNGYALANWRFKGSEVFFTILIVGAFIPYQVMIYPIVIVLRELGIYGTLTGLIIVHTIFGMPILTLLLVILAHMVRNTRAAILSVMASPYIEMARLKGEPEKRVVVRQALPNAIGPIASVVALNLAYLISGVVVIEVVFVYPGVGQAMIDAVRNRDVPVIQACALIFAAAYIGFNLIADIISIVSNPRLLHPR